MLDDDGRDRRPRTEAVRLLAAATYLPGVAPFVLLSPRRREIRLLAFHAFMALGLQAGAALLLVLGSGLSALLGALPGIGLALNLTVGVGFLLVIGGGVVLAGQGAWAAYAGTYTRVPGLAGWAWRRVNAAAPPPRAGRRRRRAAEDLLTLKRDVGDAPGQP
ncbi:MAG: hypothetical protein VKQ33_11545 [Candidatus Sericytochromatia bacterium]|nr:hypothetical protein [Candidatus Sericytochromatia bacterium]